MTKTVENRMKNKTNLAILVGIITLIVLTSINIKFDYDKGFNEGYTYTLKMTGTEPCWYTQESYWGYGTMYFVKNIPKGNGELGFVQVEKDSSYLNEVKECET